MGISRRTLLLSGGAVVVAAGLAAFNFRPQGFVEIGRAALRRVYGRNLPSDVVEPFLADADVFLRRETKLDSAQTLYFMDAAFGLPEGYDGADWIEAFMIHRFAMSSTVIAAAETGEPVEYTGFFDPHGAPCSNQLSAFNAPL
ncbi:hypothetical protein [Neptunicoccus cionae]|uniref:hypothetical protein n=1 Tax=Neptunicoccus cionae TaxID=2035344 RepID=UPI000C7671C9|nr:hypothetical protein [Amylibacter cionae]PLS21774.1 hypothetical protein C0U40_09810 [Amylibacter cionae]